MRGAIYNNGVLAGYLERDQDGKYIFRYEDAYYNSEKTTSISLTLPKTQQTYQSDTMFSFFHGLLSEGINKDIQCRLLKIDERDDFTRLLRTAGDDTIGAITIKRID